MSPLLSNPKYFPDFPDPTSIMKSSTEAVKSVAKGGVNVVADLANGIKGIVFTTSDGAVSGVKSAVTTLVDTTVSTLKRDIEEGRTTVDKVRADIDQALNSSMSQVDNAFGQEIIRRALNDVKRKFS